MVDVTDAVNKGFDKLLANLKSKLERQKEAVKDSELQIAAIESNFKAPKK